MRTFTIGQLAFGALALLLAQAAPASAVTVGNFDSGNCYPALCNDSGTSTGQTIDWQEVYSHNAFSGPLTIDSITFFFDQSTAGLSNVLAGDYTVSLSYSAFAPGSLSTTLANNVGSPQVLFSSGHVSGLDSANPSTTITGAPFSYDPGLGDLLLEIVASNQANVPNYSGNGYFEADSSSTLISRAYCVTNKSCGSSPGALVTEFNASVPEPITLSLFGAGIAGLAGLRLRRKKSS